MTTPASDIFFVADLISKLCIPRMEWYYSEYIGQSFTEWPGNARLPSLHEREECRCLTFETLYVTLPYIRGLTQSASTLSKHSFGFLARRNQLSMACRVVLITTASPRELRGGIYTYRMWALIPSKASPIADLPEHSTFTKLIPQSQKCTGTLKLSSSANIMKPTLPRIAIPGN